MDIYNYNLVIYIFYATILYVQYGFFHFLFITFSLNSETLYS